MNYWTASLRDSGWFATAGAVVFGLCRRIHNLALATSLPGRPKLRVHPSASVRGGRHIVIGRNFTAARGLWLEAVTRDGESRFNPELKIGDNVTVNENVHIAAVSRVTIGDDVLMASRVYISDHNHGVYGPDEHSSPDLAPRQRPLTTNMPVVIGNRVWLGEMVSILPGVTVGHGSIIGAGSVVVRDVPPESIAVGAPARVIKRYDRARNQWVAV